jgi:hypothetical protein
MGSPHRSAAWWRPILERQESSGLSGAEFCQQNELPMSTFYRWRKRLTAPTEAVAEGSVAFVELRAVEGAGRDAEQPGVGVPLELLLSEGRFRGRVVVPPGFDPQTLAELLSVLEARA